MSSIKSRQPRLIGKPIGAAIALCGLLQAGAAPLPDQLDRSQSLARAALACRLAMSSLAAGVSLALLALIWHLRKRSRNPLPEPESVASILSAGEPPDSESGAAGWERPADWWRPKT